MSFHIPTRARKFFQVVTERNQRKYLMFDSWYICALIGLRERRLGSLEDVEGDAFLPSYPDDYRLQADYIAGLLIDAEIERNRVDVSRKTDVEQQMILLLEPSQPTGLSVKGSELLNRYAAGGFEVIEDRMTAPANIEDLLVAYAGMWTDDEDDS